ncbi:MAG: ribosome biogenesis GTPase Der [Betaproteobacteria bacterium TMED82]|nr:MAG: ribosome biogenesis GTPase Der [Betaproteobacteria bacterium TMED82]|tara:strand:+ start:96002 stop:97351 length:1350 start_codon:yes stop_codon:yes gene_type:complete
MIPVVSIVGRPNVGKSTFFNRLTKSRDALVIDCPGVTRDRQFGRCEIADTPFLLVDTGGLEFNQKNELAKKIFHQSSQAIFDADYVIFLVDGRTGVCPADTEISKQLRKLKRDVFVVVNKMEGLTASGLDNEFYELGFSSVTAVSAAHGDGVKNFVSIITTNMKKNADQNTSAEREDKCSSNRKILLSIVGRPNAGKSTLINNLVGQERVVTFDLPGTTRDSVSIPFFWKNTLFEIIDTAGIRRRSKISDIVDKFSVLKTLKVIQQSNISIFLIDATIGVTDQDLYIASMIVHAGASLVLAVNKWDMIDVNRKVQVKREITRKLNFLSWADLHYISALKEKNFSSLFVSVEGAYQASMADLPTNKLNNFLRTSQDNHPPPIKNRFRPKLRYVHQGGKNPPVIVIHGTGLNKLTADYKRYLENGFRKRFNLSGTPLKVEWKNSNNPFARR